MDIVIPWGMAQWESLHSMWEALGLSPSAASNNNDSNYLEDDHNATGGGTAHSAITMTLNGSMGTGFTGGGAKHAMLK